MKTPHPVPAEHRLLLKIKLTALALAFALESQAEPIFTIQPSPKETVASLGSRVVNRALASSTNGLIKYQWEHDGQNILNATNTTTRRRTIWLGDTSSAAHFIKMKLLPRITPSRAKAR
jgi:hypothetical protein